MAAKIALPVIEKSAAAIAELSNDALSTTFIISESPIFVEAEGVLSQAFVIQRFPGLF